MKILTPSTVLFVLINFQIIAQESSYDTTAIKILDRMGEKIGELSSCSYTLNNSLDVADPELKIIKYLIINDVYMVGPNKMKIESRGDKGHRGYWYNGKHIVYYSYDENNYAVLDVPPTIMETIDSLNRAYGIDFPAADFFYPYFTDDLIENSNQIVYRGKSNVNGKECSNILAVGSEQSIQIWIDDDSAMPMKFVIHLYKPDSHIQYEGTFSNWILNPTLQDSMFEFTPPANANKLRLIAK